MASYKLRYTFQVVDVNGDVANVSFPDFLIDTATVAALHTVSANLLGVLAASTNGKIIRQGVSILFNEAQYLVGTAPPTNAEYSSVTDGAKLNFADGLGDRISVTIPAPIEALFGTDSNVVDSTEAQVLAFIAAVANDCHDPAGGTYNLYKGGAKVGRHIRRRVTRLIP